MPPSLRRRAQPPPQHYVDPVSDTDEANEGGGVDEDVMVDDIVADEAEDEEDEDDEEVPLGSPTHLTEAPIPPNLREISTLASWTVSSSKPGCSIPQLRSPSTNLFWQSDGPQPHYLNIHFFKLVRIVGLRLYLDFEADESYTPTRIVFLAGSGGNDLVEWGEMRLEQPRGWVWVDFSGVGEASSDEEDEDEEDSEGMGIQGLADALNDSTSSFENHNYPSVSGADPMVLDQPTPTQQTPSNGSRAHIPPRRPLNALPTNTPQQRRSPKKKNKMPVLRAHLVQIKILENHQNGKDTHLRGLQIFARDNERTREERGPRKSAVGDVNGSARRKSGRPMGGSGLVGGSGGRRLGRSEWDVEPNIR
ncbi:galactose-binding like protein [Zopfia rhizophila CBS 207.26]|uniref:Galactose-binding like protein n=1 Tax=Zopfia rhizophila CBS 207.26 TaxID=1314779 RepID=A0A6A6EV40_9PEZI|nr:galactose-binding like protein [Zopfia rhizophila CBS 207.26]